MVRRFLLAWVLAALFGGARLSAAVGCDLNDPDRDVKRLFPGATGYKTRYLSIDRLGGQAMRKRIEDRLGDPFRGLYETVDVPYTVYEIYKGKDKVGYIHGVNQKGQYGGLQVFLSLDFSGIIRAFYYQKLTSKQARTLRSPEFAAQFAGWTLDDFKGYDVQAGRAVGEGGAGRIRNPAPEAETDFRATLRAVKKNLILMDEFGFSNAPKGGQ